MEAVEVVEDGSKEGVLEEGGEKEKRVCGVLADVLNEDVLADVSKDVVMCNDVSQEA